MRALLALIPLSMSCSEYDLSDKTSTKDGVPPGPEIEVDPKVLDFGLHPLGEVSSKARVVTVKNIGT